MIDEFERDLKKIHEELRGFDYAGCFRHIAQLLHELGYIKPKPLAWDDNANRHYEPVERLAKQIYDDFEYDGPPGTTKPKWQDGANGIKHDQARAIARAALRTAGQGNPDHIS
jgi:hypothetical protein